jgi:hypothetical protein
VAQLPKAGDTVRARRFHTQGLQTYVISKVLYAAGTDLLVVEGHEDHATRDELLMLDLLTVQIVQPADPGY